MSDRSNYNVAQFADWIRAAFDAALLAGQPLPITLSACQSIATPTAIVALGKAAGAMAEGARASGITASGIIITTDENHRKISGFDCLASVVRPPRAAASGQRTSESASRLLSVRYRRRSLCFILF